MKIAYVVPSLINSGPLKVVHQLVSELSEDNEIDVYYFKVVQGREQLKFLVPTYKIKFIEAIDFDKYDIIHSHGIMSDAYVWWHSFAIKKAKTVTTLHNYAKEELTFTYGFIKGYIFIYLWQLATSKHDKIIVLSKNALQYYKKFWWNKSLAYVYNGVQYNKNKEYNELVNNKKEKIKIGSIASAGGINIRKGIDQIIKALVKLPSYELYIAGKKSEESNVLENLAKSLEVFDRVHFVGYVTDMDSFISDMDIFIVASRSEGFPLSLQEIVSYKKPVICSNIAIFKEIFSEDEVGFFKLEDIDNLVEVIKSFRNAKSEYPQKAYTRFLAEYTSKMMARNYLEIYKSLISKDKNVR